MRPENKLSKQIKKILKRRLSTSSSSSEEMIAPATKIKKNDVSTAPILEEASTSQPNENLNDADEHMLEHEPEEEVQIMESVDSEDEQLFGRDYPDKMVEIGKGVWCKRKILQMALGSSHRATHVARKLLEGVFKTESLLKSTLTGISARSQGKERQQETVHPLAFTARNVIVEYSLDIAKKKGWTPQTAHTVERSMSQRIGELKRSSK